MLPGQPESKDYENTDIVLEIPNLDVGMPIVHVPLAGREWEKASSLRQQTAVAAGWFFQPATKQSMAHVSGGAGLLRRVSIRLRRVILRSSSG